LKLFSFQVIEILFRVPLSVLTLCSKTFSALDWRFNGFISLGKPYPSSLPEGLVQVGALAPMSFMDLSGTLTIESMR
jgi:hypothetical protein